MTTHLHQFEIMDDGLPDFDRDLAHDALDDLLSKDHHDLDAATPNLTGGPSHGHDVHGMGDGMGLAGHPQHGGEMHSGKMLPPAHSGHMPPSAGHGKGIAPAGCDFPVCCFVWFGVWVGCCCASTQCVHYIVCVRT